MILRSFSDTLGALRYGELNEELTRELASLAASCQRTGKAGVLTLKLGLRPTKSGAFEFFDVVDVKHPKADRASSLLFVTKDGQFSRNDPRQLEFTELRTVDPETGEIRSVANE